MKWSVSICLVLILSFFGFTQNDNVSEDSFDSDKLNAYMMEYTNQLRSKKRRNSLMFYTWLCPAAKNHADYMASNNYLGHSQRKIAYRTVRDRVQKFGRDADFIGENVQYLSLAYEIEKANNNLTYSRLASILISNWRKSKGHYANMIDKAYTGIAHQFAIKDGILYACQILTSKPYFP